MTSRYIDVSQLAANSQNLSIQNRRVTSTETRTNRWHKKETKEALTKEKQTDSNKPKWQSMSQMLLLNTSSNAYISSRI